VVPQHGTAADLGAWTYWEKFDYWAVSGDVHHRRKRRDDGLPERDRAVFAGLGFQCNHSGAWRGAFLCAVFLFTVHFFNNHFRPINCRRLTSSCLPACNRLRNSGANITDQYNRLVASGELDKYLVDSPSGPMTLVRRFLV